MWRAHLLSDWCSESGKTIAPPPRLQRGSNGGASESCVRGALNCPACIEEREDMQSSRLRKRRYPSELDDVILEGILWQYPELTHARNPLMKAGPIDAHRSRQQCHRMMRTPCRLSCHLVQ
ncbi:GH22457 [Drosophila grimshawi]|uniref:GH17209 n=1 Tax=Drosophila grimshawi TaxID=7222 RepID=B4J1W3_DROGR|nr:GH17209 [Drosophila grimshawi]EDW04508.1 GH22457 [Drosophila grimshawi]